jgi:hypothetical protein
MGIAMDSGSKATFKDSSEKYGAILCRKLGEIHPKETGDLGTR